MGFSFWSVQNVLDLVDRTPPLKNVRFCKIISRGYFALVNASKVLKLNEWTKSGLNEIKEKNLYEQKFEGILNLSSGGIAFAEDFWRFRSDAKEQLQSCLGTF